MEYAPYIIIWLIMFFFGERYKDISTKKYAIFLVFICFLFKTFSVFVDGESFMLDKHDLMLFSFVLCIGTFLFHLQKKCRGKKTSRVT